MAQVSESAARDVGSRAADAVVVSDFADDGWAWWIRSALEKHGLEIPILPSAFASTDEQGWLDLLAQSHSMGAGLVLLILGRPLAVDRSFWNEKGRIAVVRVTPDVEPLPYPTLDLYDLHETDAVERLERFVAGLGLPLAPAEPSTADEAAPEASSTFNVRPRALSDLPSTVDLLGHRALVDALHALVTDPRTSLPLAVAVTAPWGAGKSSIMHQLRTRLERTSRPRSPSRPTRRVKLRLRGLRLMLQLRVADSRSPPEIGRSRRRVRVRLGRRRLVHLYWLRPIRLRPRPPRRWYTVVFEAWKYERSERLWAALAKAIYDQPQRQMPWRERIRFRLRLERSRTGVFAIVVKGLAPAAALAGGVGALLAQLGMTYGLFGAVGTALVGALGSAGRWWAIVTDPFKRAIDRYAERPTHRGHLGFTADADAEIAALTAALTRGGDDALVIFVDDLDRCSTRSIVEVVEAINQIFNASSDRPFVFVLGMDRELVAAALDVAYRDWARYVERAGRDGGVSFGTSFLAKIVQLSVAVPRPDLPALDRFLARLTGNAPPTRADAPGEPDPRDVSRLTQLLKRQGAFENPADVAEAAQRVAADFDDVARAALDEAVKSLRAPLLHSDSPDVAAAEFETLQYLDRNPRQVKRFDNAFRLQLHVASSAAGASLAMSKDQLVAFGKWVALQLRWPDLADEFERKPALLPALEELANGDGTGEDEKAARALQAWFERRPGLQDLLHEEDPARRLAAVRQTFLHVS